MQQETKNIQLAIRPSTKIDTSLTRMKLDRTSIIVVVVQTGALNVNDTDVRTVFSKDDMGSEDLDPGRIMCLFPLSHSFSPMGESKNFATTCD